MKKLLLAILALAFAFSIASCNQRDRGCGEGRKCGSSGKEERHSRRW